MFVSDNAVSLSVWKSLETLVGMCLLLSHVRGVCLQDVPTLRCHYAPIYSHVDPRAKLERGLNLFRAVLRLQRQTKETTGCGKEKPTGRIGCVLLVFT